MEKGKRGAQMNTFLSLLIIFRAGEKLMTNLFSHKD